MTRDELYTFFTSLNGGEAIDDALFDSYLDIAQAVWEQTRPWMTLRDVDSSQTVSASNTVTNTFSLPATFSRWYDSKRSIGLWDGTNVMYVLQVPKALSLIEKSIKFFVDYTTNLLGFTGNFARSYTIYQYFIKTPPLVSEQVNSAYPNTWVFPVRFHKYLPLAAVVFYKLGVDYDLVNNKQADQHAAMAAKLLDAAENWDDELQSASVQGMGVYDNDGFRNHSLGPDWPNSTGY